MGWIHGGIGGRDRTVACPRCRKDTGASGLRKDAEGQHVCRACIAADEAVVSRKKWAAECEAKAAAFAVAPRLRSDDQRSVSLYDWETGEVTETVTVGELAGRWPEARYTLDGQAIKPAASSGIEIKIGQAGR